MSPRKKSLSPSAALQEFALTFPGAVLEHPWGENVVKVKGKIFVFLGMNTTDGSFGLSVKLPGSAHIALELPFTKPTGYGLGKAGWVSARFSASDEVPVPLLMAWIEESYRAVAPKTLVKQLAQDAPAEPRKRPGNSARS
ncbi:MAG: MmcQ/YjbR family DNA-binding protein [Candidatus Eisenbacteria bacterium]